MLAGVVELGEIEPAPGHIAVCDEAAALLEAAWPGVEQVRMAVPSAADALRFVRKGAGSLAIWRRWMGIICAGRMRRSLARRRGRSGDEVHDS